MSFPILICTNCDKEKDDDNFLLLGLTPKEKGKSKNNYIDSNLVSFSDNNNSTNNYLEIIEYPYSSNNNQVENDNDNKIKETIYKPVITEIAQKKKKLIDYDDDLLDIKPPKLFTEQCEDEKSEIKNIKIENENKSVKNIPIENNYKNESHEKMDSNISESLINDDNNIMNNKILLSNYYLNSQSRKKTLNHMEKIKSNQIKEETKTINDINNLTNSNNKKIELKINYPFPDTNSPPLNYNKNISLKKENIKKEEIKKSEKTKLNENKEKNLFHKKIKNKIEEKNINKKISKFNFIKPKNKAKSFNNFNIDIIKNNFRKKKEGTNYDFKNRIIKKKNISNLNDLSNYGKKFNLKSKNSNDEINSFFTKTESYNFGKSNNILLINLLHKKINDRNKKNLKTFLEKRKKENTSYLSRIENQSRIYSSKTYINPFIKAYKEKN